VTLGITKTNKQLFSSFKKILTPHRSFDIIKLSLCNAQSTLQSDQAAILTRSRALATGLFSCGTDTVPRVFLFSFTHNMKKLR
jgi:hypothetical protein